MQPLNIKNISIGEGIPKICVPIVGITEQAVLAEAKAILDTPADLAEWRMDWYQDVFDTEQTAVLAGKLHQMLGEKPLLVTFRTKKEGGEKEITKEVYEKLYQEILQKHAADLIDVELFFDTDVLDRLIRLAHENEIAVIASNHDFKKTPGQNEIVKRLCRMQDAGADIAKIAVMPQCREDVLTLFSATAQMRQRAKGPVITMSMGPDGIGTRLLGEIFGSAVTFGSAAKASAPGQIDITELSKILHVLHKNYREQANDSVEKV